MNNDLTLTPADRQFGKAQQRGTDVEQLYSLFSELLERKLKEMEEHRPKRSIAGNRRRLESGADDEIHDDYMLQFGSGSKLHKLEEVEPESGLRIRRKSTSNIELSKIRDERSYTHH
ncbi:hypothetical protein WR25_17545 [Diploscapter pachys]|uniref:Uncharacterized protein n=1 Tax=Diploscapter pachys TaxID=2018661 RepID=A0A2A2J412_9BILA|nr:hypothetical protein WR25_17545 [Diploscapter pachys]